MKEGTITKLVGIVFEITFTLAVAAVAKTTEIRRVRNSRQITARRKKLQHGEKNFQRAL